MNYAGVSVRPFQCSLLLFSLTLELASNIKYSKFTYPRLYRLVDPRVGIDYFAKKLNFEGFVADHLILKHSKPFVDWLQEYKVIRESVRNIDACSLKKTDPTSRAWDMVSKIGSKNCLEQCKMEHEAYFEFLNNKLQKLIRKKFYKADVRIVHVAVNSSNIPENYYKCAKLGYKRYTCQCIYPGYEIETSEQIKEQFPNTMNDVYGLLPSPENWKIFEERYKMPIKLIAFLIICHLLPKEIFEFLVWWDTTENPEAYTTTTTTGNSISSDEEQKTAAAVDLISSDEKSARFYFDKTTKNDSISSDEESKSVLQKKGNKRRRRRNEPRGKGHSKCKNFVYPYVCK